MSVGQWCEGKTPSPTPGVLVPLLLPLLASGGMSELRASPDCHWPESVHVWDQCLFPSVLQQTGGAPSGQDKLKGVTRGCLSQALHSLGVGGQI